MARIVVKVGTSTLTHSGGGMNFKNMDRLARTLADVHNAGNEVVLVSSGAIGCGCGKLKLAQRPTDIAAKQAAAAVGQCELMHLYDKFFGEYGVTTGQILLTREDCNHPEIKENLVNTFTALLHLGVIPVVNENDSVSYAEISADHATFGENDTLSAVVAGLCGADLLVLLSDIDGLYDDDPHRNPDAHLIDEVCELTPALLASAHGAGTGFGTGGMVTKLTAARIAMEQGFDMAITNGAEPENINFLVKGGRIGTIFRGKKARHDGA
ncbi:MAG: glutamate 5-kinase [Oscillospiraceae bacterium]|nr:glutamate 5-kinase [Oscillospiraceae bacterium]